MEESTQSTCNLEKVGDKATLWKYKAKIKKKIIGTNTDLKKTAQLKSNNLVHLIDPIFRKIKRLLTLLFKKGNDDPTKNYFDECYMPLVVIKDFNALID